MTIHRGRGFAAINYPIGMNLGGDPSQALVHSNPDGKFMVALSSIDLGQGMKSVTRQIAAETLGIPVEDVYVDTADSDTGPHCMGSFASRGTHRVGNAVIAAATEARAVMMETWAQPPLDGTAAAGVAATAVRTSAPAAPAAASAAIRRRTGLGFTMTPIRVGKPDDPPRGRAAVVGYGGRAGEPYSE